MLDTTRTLLDLANKPYLLPLIILSCVSTLRRIIPKAAKSWFDCWAEVVNYYYECRARCASSKAHFEQASMKGP